jgi:hypothetical protein
VSAGKPRTTEARSLVVTKHWNKDCTVDAGNRLPDSSELQLCHPASSDSSISPKLLQFPQNAQEKNKRGEATTVNTKVDIHTLARI